MVHGLKVLVTGAFVFAAGWRLADKRHSMACAVASLLFFLLHPGVLSETSAPAQLPSPADALFVMAFLTAWVWTEHWSYFMRSWMLALVYAAGLWSGTAFVVWGMLALAIWVVFNRRPLPAVGSFLTILLGGLVLYGASWGVAHLTVGQTLALPPIFQKTVAGFRMGVLGDLSVRPYGLFVQWNLYDMVNWVTLPWGLLTLWVAAERLATMVLERRSDASAFAAALLGVIGGLCLYGAATGRWLWGGELDVLAALSAPLVAREIVQREFLFHRGVRIGAGAAAMVGLGCAWFFRQGSAAPSALTMGLILGASPWLPTISRMPWRLRAQAILLGTYFATSGSTFLRLLVR